MSRAARTRLARLESTSTTPEVDLIAEAERHGDRMWSVGGTRCYGQQTDEAARLTIVGAPGGDLVYEVVGFDLGLLR